MTPNCFFQPRLLKRLFTPDEARIALRLLYQPTPTAQIVAGAAPDFSAGQTEHLLDSLLMKGAIG